MKRFFIIAILISFAIPQGAFAYAFNKNNIISDYDLTDSSSMSLGRIQEFLAQKGGYLSNYNVNVSGTIKSAASVIFKVANEFTLNPKYLLTTLQKEQSLVTVTSPSQTQLDWALGYGVCDSCNYNTPSIQAFKGFYNQMYYSAKRIRSDAYLGGLEAGGTTISGWAPGITKIVDGETVIPVNNATSVLYTYTPHIHGNYNFWKIWSRWFLKHYPNGSLLRVRGEPGIWLIRDGKRYNFTSKSAFVFSYDLNKVLDVSLNDIQAYEYGAPIKFAEFSLLQTPQGGVYILINGEKRAIKSRKVFQSLGYSPEELVQVSWEDLEAYPEGDEITLDTAYPAGLLLQSRQTGAIYFIDQGVRRPIRDRHILFSQFANKRWTQVDQSEIDKYPEGVPVKFRDGELVTSPNAGAVFLIADGEKLPFPSLEVFQQMGYNWSNIIWTTDQALQLHPLGEALDYLT